MAAPLLRPIHPSDFGAIHGLLRRAETHDGIPVVTPREEIEQWLDIPHFDLEADSRLIEVAGEMAGWGRISHRPSEGREISVLLPGVVDPARRRHGIGSALLAWQIERASEVSRKAGSELPRFVRAQSYDFQHSAQRLFARFGLAPARHHDEMLRDLARLPASPIIDGVRIAGWDPAFSEAARVAQNVAFADHWGSTPRDRLTWEHFLVSHGTRQDLSFLAFDGERTVGVCVNGHFPDDETVTGRRDGWIMQVGVVPSHRKRGLATALIAASLDAFERAGFSHAALGVDSQNPSGAYGLYERLGFRRMHRRTLYQKAV